MSTFVTKNIALIREPYAKLQTENKTYWKGQVVFAEMPDGTVGMKVGTKDIKDQSGGIAFNLLPWIIDPTVAYGGNKPFIVRNTDDGTNGVEYTYDPTTGIVTIRTSKLIGITDPVIVCTQNNTTLRDADYAIDSVNGVLTIISIQGGLQDTEKIVITTGDGVIPGTSEYDNRLSALEKVTAPMTSGNVRMFWLGTIDTIPAGWTVDSTMAGRMAIGVDPNDTDLKAVLATLGSKTHTITIDEMPAHDHEFALEDCGQESSQGYGLPINTGGYQNRVLVKGQPAKANNAFTTKQTGQGKAMSILNPVIVGYWIKYTG